MFDTLSDRLDHIFKTLKGQGTLSEKNMEDALREVRRALLEADVHLTVVKEFINQVRAEATGQKVMKSLTPGQQVIKVVHDALVGIMGERNEQLNLAAQPPVVVMMVGLQGSGKTTTTGKLAKRMLERHQKRCLLASLDVYRPAAMDQLATVGKEAGVEVVAGRKDADPRDLARQALEAARSGGYDLLFLDTAGRLHIDDDLMQELEEIKNLVDPLEILLVADAMTGQDAVGVARGFDERLNITGVVLSKTDGDARGGAALSIRHVTGKPIKFLGTGERLSGLEPFHPDRVASRILGMGDVVSLVETAMEKVDLLETMKLQEKIISSSFTLEDFLVQLQQIKKMGPLSDLMAMIPGLKQAMKGKEMEGDDGSLKRIEAIVLSMTPQERRKHQILNASRKRRVANGSGTSVQEINRLLKQFAEMQKMMKRFGKMGAKGGLGRMGLPKGLNLGALGGLKGMGPKR
ncbi:MAG: signal recognition particle protein [Magnetococcales bacterium]|nr:signal recognition particle protein [Magnetococcales bacterium]MBF0148594.1 signal recognition particle protein [Magnetococcales bacterium]MBF0172276.1 signal recognition particle protein [Magnetococcales bacterium]MBF0347323.1 signal recognition particle protein [Magnetococcales bacterium]MBF0629713.1 signal recognition particle protein [Magnetococcales bacterium]